MRIDDTTETSRVLILVDRLGVGGIAHLAVYLALSLDREQFSPIVCTTHELPAHGQDETLRQAGVPLIEVKRKSVWQMSPWISLWRVLPTVSILHTHGGGANFWGRVWGRLFRVPIIVTHYHTAADQKGRVLSFLDRVMSPLADRIVTVSQFDRKLAIRLENLDPDRVVTIYPGIEVSKFNGRLSKTQARLSAGLPTDKRLVAVIARLDPQKNHRGLMEALTLLPKDIRSQLHCLIVGSGPLEDQLGYDAMELGWQEQVSFLGERGDVSTILRAIDLLVLPSHWECLPAVILEALAAGCPVVATAVGGVPEIMNGLDWPLVKPGDPRSLAEAIARVLKMHDVERDHIAETGRQMIKDKFSQELLVTEIERQYRLLLSASQIKSNVKA